MNHQLFVYGSLRQGFNHAAYEYITRYFELVGCGTTPGTLYDLGPYPAAKPGNTGHTIKGELYRIRHADEFPYAIAQLDDYEGVDASYDQPALYARQTTTVTLEDGSTHEAWIYWYTGDTDGRPVIASGDVFDYYKKA